MLRLKYMLFILLPLFMITIIGLIFEINLLSIISGILFIDGLNGFFKSLNKPNKYTLNSKFKKIVQPFIPFGQYASIVLFGIVFTKEEGLDFCVEDANHELTHRAQGRETGWLLFYLIYFLEYIYWFIKLLIKNKFNDWKTVLNLSYYRVCFEQESYCKNKDLKYLNYRKPYIWIIYLFNTDDYNQKQELWEN